MEESMTISVMEGEPPPSMCTGDEGGERITFEVEEEEGTHQFVVNEETGEVQVIDLGDPSIRQEVEVITVDNVESTRIFHQGRKFSSSSSSSVVTAVGSLANQVQVNQNLVHRIKSAPALLRNSRRFQPADHSHHSGVGGSSIILGGRHSSSLTASQLPVPQASASILSKTQGRHFAATSSSHHHVAVSNTSGMSHSSSINQQGFQQAVVLDENGQETQEYVILAPTESGELQVVERGTREMPVQQEYFQTSEVEKHDGQMTLQHQGQTIIICDDPDANPVSHLIEDEDGNLISFDGSNLTYQLEDSGGFTLDDSEINAYGDVTIGAVTASSLKLSRTKKKTKKPLQVIIGPDGQPLKKKGQTELRCMEKGCIMTCFNVSELRKHLNLTHSIQFDEETISFTNDGEFKSWRENYERERMVSFIYRGGTKKIAKDQAVTYMICHRSGHYKPTMGNETLRKRKLKPQGSCKMGGFCTAGIKLLKNLDTGMIKMEICHTHYGHPLDSDAIPHLRVNPTLRKVILGKFQEGLSFTEVLAYIHHNPDRLEGLRLVDRRAVRNIFDTWKNPTRRSKKAQQDIDELPPIPEMSSGAETFSDPSQEADGSAEPDREEADLGNHSATQTKAEKSNNLPVLHLATDDAEGGSKCVSEDTEMEPPKLIAVASCQRKTRTKSKKGTKSAVCSNTEDDSEHSAMDNEVDISIVKQEPEPEEESPKMGSYSLRPNRRVEVYKSTKVKKSQTPLDVEENAEQKKATSKKTKNKSISNVKTKQNLITKIKKEPDLPEEPLVISEKLEKAIDKLHNHSESGPTVLLYKPAGKPIKYGDTKRDFRRDDFCVVLQTPVQRQLMQMFPNVICFEVLDGPKPSQSQMKLAFLMVLDEYREAIPVAWLVSNSVESRIISNFFKAVRGECGELKVKYLVSSPRNSDAFKLWCSTFAEKPLPIQSDVDVKRDLKTLIWQHFSTDKGRREVWDIIETLLSERSTEKFWKHKDMLDTLVDKLPHTGVFPKKFEKDWMSRAEEWALCYRLKTPVNIIGISNAFGKLKKFVSFKGTKNLNESFEHILKIGYDKCFLRSKRMFKGDQKNSLFMEEIKNRHLKSRTIKDAAIEKCDEDEWIVRILSEKYAVADAGSPCDCKLICKQCKLCVHMYLCDCNDYFNTQMCEHVHLVHCNRNEIQDEPEFITGDCDPNNEHNFGLFGKFETGGTEENPGQIINIDAVLKAAGLFHRSDGLQPDQIVSITDADTQKVIYEQTPTTEVSKEPLSSLPITIIEDGSVPSTSHSTENMTATEIAVKSLNLQNDGDASDAENTVAIMSTDEFHPSQLIADAEQDEKNKDNTTETDDDKILDSNLVSEQQYILTMVDSNNEPLQSVYPNLESETTLTPSNSADVVVEGSTNDHSETNKQSANDSTNSTVVLKTSENEITLQDKPKDIVKDYEQFETEHGKSLLEKEQKSSDTKKKSAADTEEASTSKIVVKDVKELRRSSRVTKPDKETAPKRSTLKKKATVKELTNEPPKKRNRQEVEEIHARRTSMRRK